MKSKLMMSKILAVLLVMILNIFCFQTVFAADASATVNIPVYNTITGDTPYKDEPFTFTLTSVDGSPMPSGSAGGVKTVTISGAEDTAFGVINYTEPGDYHYTISEVAGSNAAYEYDTTIYSLTVQVTWKTEPAGELQALMYLVKQGDIVKQEKAAFSNQYIAPVTSLDIPVKKLIKGDTPLIDSTFTFLLKAENADYPMPLDSANGVKSLAIKGAGTGDFEQIDYTRPGVYNYTVYEKDDGLNGYTYDTNVYTISVTVTETETNGLISSMNITDKNGNKASSLVFSNQYTEKITNIPKTGDSSQNYIWWILLGAATIGIGIALRIGIQRKKH